MSQYSNAHVAQVSQSPDTGLWWMNLLDADGSSIQRLRIPDVSRDFYDEGLNIVGTQLNSLGLGYHGAAAWQDLPGGGWEATVYELRK